MKKHFAVAAAAAVAIAVVLAPSACSGDDRQPSNGETEGNDHLLCAALTVNYEAALDLATDHGGDLDPELSQGMLTFAFDPESWRDAPPDVRRPLDVVMEGVEDAQDGAIAPEDRARYLQAFDDAQRAASPQCP